MIEYDDDRSRLDRAVIEGFLTTEAYWGRYRAPADIGYVPLVSRQIAWTVLVDPKTADVLGFLPIDAF